MSKNGNHHDDFDHEGEFQDKVNFKQYLRELKESDIDDENDIIAAQHLFSTGDALVVGLSKVGLGEDLHLTEQEWNSIKTLVLDEDYSFERDDLTWFVSLDHDSFLVFDSGFHGSYARVKRADAIRKFA